MKNKLLGSVLAHFFSIISPYYSEVYVRRWGHNRIITVRPKFLRCWVPPSSYRCKWKIFTYGDTLPLTDLATTVILEEHWKQKSPTVNQTFQTKKDTKSCLYIFTSIYFIFIENGKMEHITLRDRQKNIRIRVIDIIGSEKETSTERPGT